MRSLLSAVLSTVVSALPVFLVASLGVTLENEFRFGPTELGLLLSTFFLAAALLSVPLSRLTDFVDPSSIMRTAYVVVGVILLLFVGFGDSLGWLASMLALVGVVSAATQPATNAFIVERVLSNRRGLAFGAKQSAVPAAVALSGAAVPVVGVALGWRWTFVIAGIVALLGTFGVPGGRGHISVRDAKGARVMSKMNRNRLVLLAVGAGAASASANALAGFIMSAALAVGQTETAAGVLTTCAGATTILVRLASGWYADITRRDISGLVVVMLGIGTIGYLLLALASGAAPSLLVPGSLLAFAAGWGWTGLLIFYVAGAHEALAARATAFIEAGTLIGGVVGPAIFGSMVEQWSFGVAWIGAAIAAAAGAAVIQRGRPRTSK